MRKFDVMLSEVVREDDNGYYVVSLDQLDPETGEVLLKKESEDYDNLGDAMDAFAKLQYEWYWELNVSATTDEWRVHCDLTL